MPEVTLIVLTYNSVSKLGNIFDKAVSSFLNQEGVDYKLIFVDNSSSDRTVEYLKRTCRVNCGILRLSKNYGWSGANNRASVLVKDSEFLFFLNDDVILARDTTKKLTEFCRANPDVGAVQPVIIDKSGVRIYGYDVGLSGLAHYVTKPRGSPFSESFYVEGSALFTPAKVFFEVGMFPESFFLYYDDVDYCWRLRLAGYKAGCLTTTWAYHYRSATFGERSPIFFYLNTRNRIWSICANSGMFTLPIRLYLNTIYISRCLVTERSSVIVKSIIKGSIDGLRGLKIAFSKRILTQSLRKVSEGKINNAMNVYIDINLLFPRRLRRRLGVSW